MSFRTFVKLGSRDTDTKPVQLNCSLILSKTALASVVFPSPPKPTIETILCSADEMPPSSVANSEISSSLGSSMPTSLAALVYRAVMRGSVHVLVGVTESTLYLLPRARIKLKLGQNGQ